MTDWKKMFHKDIGHGGRKCSCCNGLLRRGRKKDRSFMRRLRRQLKAKLSQEEA